MCSSDLGQPEVAIVPFSTALPLVRAGKLKALGVPSANRVAQLPEVPTIAETVPGVVAPGWQGLFLPSRSPAEVAPALHRAVTHALAAPEVRERLHGLSYDIIGSTPEQFKPVFEADVARFQRIVRDAKIPLQD